MRRLARSIALLACLGLLALPAPGAGASSAPPSPRWPAETGVYLFPGGRSLAIFPSFAGGRGLCFTDGLTGALRCLSDQPAGAYGDTVVLEGEARGRLRFLTSQDGRPGVEQQEGEHEPPETGWKLALTMEDVSFHNGRTRLAGTLILPAVEGPHPAIVLTHGSGPSTRDTDAGLPMGLFFAQHGMAALIYDKRGHGESAGLDGVSAPFLDLAGDALAGVEMLRARFDIDPARVGLFGHSQGAWIAPLAASRSPHIAFVVMECGGGVTPMEQTQWHGRSLLRLKIGLTPDEIDEALAFRRLKYVLAATGKGRREMEAALPAARSKRWFPHITERMPSQPFWKHNGSYDPAPALAALRCPVLAIFGAQDSYTPLEASRATLEKAFRAGGVSHTVKVYPANHALLETATGGMLEDELPGLSRFAPGYFEDMASWLRDRMLLPSGG